MKYMNKNLFLLLLFPLQLLYGGGGCLRQRKPINKAANRTESQTRIIKPGYESFPLPAPSFSKTAYPQQEPPQQQQQIAPESTTPSLNIPAFLKAIDSKIALYGLGSISRPELIRLEKDAYKILVLSSDISSRNAAYLFLVHLDQAKLASTSTPETICSIMQEWNNNLTTITAIKPKVKTYAQ